MSLKKAAEDLLEVANRIEKEAAEVTRFVCDKCNHTATLASINAKRKEAAEGLENVTVSDINVNDTVSCPACEGTMSYQASEESEAYYYDPEVVAAAKKETEDVEAKKNEKVEEDIVEAKKEECPECAEKTASIDYDSLERYTSK